MTDSDYAAYMEDLARIAREAGIAEEEFRKEASRRAGELRLARAYAYRRVNLLRAVGRGVAGAPDTEEAAAKGRAVFYRETGWNGGTEPQREAAARFAPVILAIWQATREAAAEEEEEDAHDAPAPDVRAALADFESWYGENRKGAFLDLMEREIVELPLVEV